MFTPQNTSPRPRESYPDGSRIHDLFASQAARTPGALALVDGRETWTYTQLDHWTNRLARRLQAAGVGPEIVTGCYVQNPVHMVIHVLAILKAGGAYLLLDPQLPDARLRYMVTDASPAVVLYDAPLPKMVTPAVRASLSMDHLTATAAKLSAAPLTSTVTPSNAAYLAYTSGSTGRPKGVVITHGSTVAHARAFAELFRLEPRDRIPLMAPAAFDMATEEMFPALLSGCTLIASTSTHRDMKEFTNEIASRLYSVLNIPSPLWQLWTEYLHDNRLPVPPFVRLVITGSDKIYTRTWREWRHLLGADRVQWAAAYGTTEATVTSSFYLTAATDDLTGEPLVPIGKPISGTHFYIVDREDPGRLVPDGTVGELMIGGLGLARGYVNLPVETHAKFLPNPFSRQEGARLYKTGDLARRRPDGSVVWVGRVDLQIKHNGLRIEPGEIEAVLADHPDVRGAVVALRPGSGPDRSEQLTAYVVPRAGRELDVGSLAAHIRARAHPLMVPSIFEVLQSIPLNPNGKLERKELRGAGRRGPGRRATP
jgi:amino acid adenylation domain-containing protein